MRYLTVGLSGWKFYSPYGYFYLELDVIGTKTL